MAKTFETLQAFCDAGFDTVIDVRAPSEFAEDHIPGAISLPVLSDAERADVGTIYVQDSPFKARKLGAALVARNAADHICGPLADKDGSWRPLVYCWRGGQRSNSFASILSQIGWRTEVVDGGYRTYRRLVVDLMHKSTLPHALILLDGNTGTAKTDLLLRLGQLGVQIIDLEGLAAHRGSLFGAVAGGQPSQKMFESRLAAAIVTLDPTRPVLLEAESSRIGDLNLPASLWTAMCAAPRIEVQAPPSERAGYLVRAYSDVISDRMRMADTLAALTSVQGHERVESWQKMAVSGDHVTLAQSLMQEHYDPRYRRWRARQNVVADVVLTVNDMSETGLDLAAEQLADRIAAGITAR